MAKDPTYPMYAQDFDMDTSFWTSEEIGVYIRLLNACWINNGLPNDISKLARISRMEKTCFEAIWNETIESKFYEKSGVLLNKKQEEVRQYRNKQKNNGSKGGRPKKDSLKNRNKTQTETEIKPKQNLSNEIEIEVEKGNLNGNGNGNGNGKNRSEKPEIIYPFETEVFKAQWQHWKVYKRKEFKFRYVSLQSEQAALSELANLSDHSEKTAIEIIHQSMSSGWKGFFELKDQKNGKPKQVNTGQQGATDEFRRKTAQRLGLIQPD